MLGSGISCWPFLEMWSRGWVMISCCRFLACRCRFFAYYYPWFVMSDFFMWCFMRFYIMSISYFFMRSCGIFELVIFYWFSVTCKGLMVSWWILWDESMMSILLWLLCTFCYEHRVGYLYVVWGGWLAIGAGALKWLPW